MPVEAQVDRYPDHPSLEQGWIPQLMEPTATPDISIVNNVLSYIRTN
jgi:hypothetical protein